MSYRFPIAFALLLLLLTIGCQGSSQPTAYPTTGLITFEGEPMKGGGAISFIPIGPQTGKPAGGLVNEDGTFSMTTYRQGDGSVAGKFRVIIMQTTTSEPTMVASDDGGEPVMSSGPIETVNKSQRIPLIYADSAKSPITVEVTPQGNNQLTIDLTRKPT
ncbi:hypothetical protein [Bremerella cremea]|uniref:hypothetical protein n=1 Tax=Bremerella cremea TaxID=1031537 RepID=UPI0031E9248E